RQFNSATVLLARLRDRAVTTDRELRVEIEVAHFGPKPLASATPVWRIVDAAGRAVARGALPARAIPRGKNPGPGPSSVDLGKLRARAAYRLVVELQDTAFRNEWNFWLYPGQVNVAAPPGITVTGSWTEAKAALGAGGRVLFLSGAPEKPSPD